MNPKHRRSRHYCLNDDNDSMYCTYKNCKIFWAYGDYTLNRKECEWYRGKLNGNS